MTSSVVMINTFEIQAGGETEFLIWWERSSEALRKEPGFIDAQLHKNLKSESSFQFINIAHWETEAALNEARLKNKEVLHSLTVGKGHPALYEMTMQYAPGMLADEEEARPSQSSQTYATIVCPNCQRECQVTGRMQNSIYAWCQCKRYIEVYDKMSHP
ncbi:MAG TPA: antibiotic biosynthesis monooxygenase family protein [Ktedonobacteraceae bacterium]